MECKKEVFKSRNTKAYLQQRKHKAYNYHFSKFNNLPFACRNKQEKNRIKVRTTVVKDILVFWRRKRPKNFQTYKGNSKCCVLDLKGLEALEFFFLANKYHYFSSHAQLESITVQQAREPQPESQKTNSWSELQHIKDHQDHKTNKKHKGFLFFFFYVHTVVQTRPFFGSELGVSQTSKHFQQQNQCMICKHSVYPNYETLQEDERK